MPDQLEENKTEEKGPHPKMVVEEVGSEEASTTEPTAEKQSETTDISQDPPELIAPEQTPTINPLIIILPGILILGALLGGIVFYQKMSVDKEVEIILTPTPIISTETPTPTSVPVLKELKEKYEISILNGSGLAGEAGKVQKLVMTDGFRVGGTGNADNYSYTKTIIKAKESVEKEYLEALTKILEKNYQVDKLQTLTPSSSDNVQVVVGSLKSAN